MRNLLLASVATLALAVQPTLAGSLSETSNGADGMGTAEAGVEAGAALQAPQAPTDLVTDDLTTTEETAADDVAAARNAIDGAALIGKTVVDASGEAVGTVSNAVLAAGGDTTEKVVIESGGIFGFGARHVAIDSANIDASTASEGQVRLIGLTAADLETMLEFEADAATRLANPS